MHTDEQLRKQLPINYGHSPLLRLRWRFDFKDKPSKVGQWNGTSQNPCDMAAYINKAGLIRMAVEGEKISQWVTKTIFDVVGSEYVSCQWRTALSAPGIGGPMRYVKSGDVIALVVKTNKYKITVFVDGQMKRELLTEDELKFKIFEHNLGG